MKVINRILGEAMTPEQKSIYKNPRLAYTWSISHGQRFPEAEPYIATDPEWAYGYAWHIIKGRWPEGEETVIKNPQWAYYYAKDVIKDRWPEGEFAIANSRYKDFYLQEFPDAKDDWLLNGWIDWLDT